MPDDMGIFEVMYNCRAMRRLKPDPVPEELLIKLIDAANQAPSGSNRQGARWIIVRAPEQKQKLAELNKKGVEAYIGPDSQRPAALPHQDAEKRTRMLRAVLWQAEHMHHIPALIIACMEFDAPVTPEAAARAGGSIGKQEAMAPAGWSHCWPKAAPEDEPACGRWSAKAACS